MRTTRVEDYLIAIEELESESERATTGQIAAYLGVANGTASSKLKELAEAGLVELEPYAGSVLSAAGRWRVSSVRRRRQLLELFLQRTVTLAPKNLSDESNRLETVASQQLIDAIDRWLGSPRIDVRGGRIVADANRSCDL